MLEHLTQFPSLRVVVASVFDDPAREFGMSRDNLERSLRDRLGPSIIFQADLVL